MDLNIEKIKILIDEAEAIVVGIGSGMTNADGISYYGERFKEQFNDFIEKYKFIDMLQASVYHFEDWQTYWAFHSRFIKMNYYEQNVSDSFFNLKTILENKNYFIVTTNSDSSLHKSNFDSKKYFYIQGQYNLMQCSKKCNNNSWEDRELIYKMVNEQKNLKVAENLIPKCLFCNYPLEVYKRNKGDVLVEDENYKIAKKRYLDFVEQNKNKKILFLEIGCGNITPQFIKWEFWRWTEENPLAKYLVLNQKQYRIDKAILNQTYFANDDIKILLKSLAEVYKKEKYDNNRTC
ncbi:SIR2 family NAD-dependent protein deacylase [[Mycoplasma] collis]|uniref:deacetylase SIR2 n=1 Tax=[Mycoplasma] collis TaxID=2127 RepID=UPI00051BB4D7|nr:deacetylase SIR2 [[Mycoplasma] collis]